MTVESPYPASKQYTNTEYDVTVTDNLRTEEEAARKIAAAVDETVEWVSISRTHTDAEKHVQIVFVDEETTEAPSEMHEVLDGLGYERSETETPGVDNYYK